jgi:thiol-disulfide isomerase/thioredoxin
MKELLEASIAKGVSYETYRAMMWELEEQGKSTGEDQSEAMVNYTKLNSHRMKRLEKKVDLLDEVKESVSNITCKLTWILLTESWCGDAAQILPVMQKVVEQTPNIDLKIILRDENLELMDLFLTNGGRSIPKVIVVNMDAMEVVSSWGPRPKPAQDMVMEYKKNPMDQTYDEFSIELQKWYTRDKSETIQREMLEFLKSCED